MQRIGHWCNVDAHKSWIGARTRGCRYVGGDFAKPVPERRGMMSTDYTRSSLLGPEAHRFVSRDALAFVAAPAQTQHFSAGSQHSHRPIASYLRLYPGVRNQRERLASPGPAARFRRWANPARMRFLKTALQ